MSGHAKPFHKEVSKSAKRRHRYRRTFETFVPASVVLQMIGISVVMRFFVIMRFFVPPRQRAAMRSLFTAIVQPFISLVGLTIH